MHLPLAHDHKQDLLGAMTTLEAMDSTPETCLHWGQLAEAALQQEALDVAERCYAATGEVAKARFLHKVRHHPLLTAWECCLGTGVLKCVPSQLFSYDVCSDGGATN